MSFWSSDAENIISNVLFWSHQQKSGDSERLPACLGLVCFKVCSAHRNMSEWQRRCIAWQPRDASLKNRAYGEERSSTVGEERHTEPDFLWCQRLHLSSIRFLFFSFMHWGTISSGFSSHPWVTASCPWSVSVCRPPGNSCTCAEWRTI